MPSKAKTKQAKPTTKAKKTAQVEKSETSKQTPVRSLVRF